MIDCRSYDLFSWRYDVGSIAHTIQNKVCVKFVNSFKCSIVYYVHIIIQKS